LERDLANYSTAKQTGSPKKTPWGAIIPLSLVAVALVAGIAVVIVRKRKQQKIRK
jgi:LPXTG-motif cell wall-anchored protein